MARLVGILHPEAGRQETVVEFAKFFLSKNECWNYLVHGLTGIVYRYCSNFSKLFVYKWFVETCRGRLDCTYGFR